MDIEIREFMSINTIYVYYYLLLAECGCVQDMTVEHHSKNIARIE